MYQRMSLRRQDMCHGEGKLQECSEAMRGLVTGNSAAAAGPGGRADRGLDDASWLVATAVAFTNDAGEPGKSIDVERFLKHGGQWKFLCRETSIPTQVRRAWY